jgi:hypothetical protein
MAPLDMDTALGWRGRTVRDRDGEKVGTLGDLYLDGSSDLPAWATVRTGLFGSRESVVPLDQVQEDGDDLRVPFAKQEVADAPRVDPDVALEPDEEDALRSHYGRGGEAREEAAQGGGAGTMRDGDGDGDADRDESLDRDEPYKPATVERGEGGPEMIRSEEELKTGTTPMQARERVRIRKVLVTDHVKRTVPVRREEVRLETDPPESGRVESSEDVP